MAASQLRCRSFLLLASPWRAFGLRRSFCVHSSLLAKPTSFPCLKDLCTSVSEFITSSLVATSRSWQTQRILFAFTSRIYSTAEVSSNFDEGREISFPERTGSLGVKQSGSQSLNKIIDELDKPKELRNGTLAKQREFLDRSTRFKNSPSSSISKDRGKSENGMTRTSHRLSNAKDVGLNAAGDVESAVPGNKSIDFKTRPLTLETIGFTEEGVELEEPIKMLADSDKRQRTTSVRKEKNTGGVKNEIDKAYEITDVTSEEVREEIHVSTEQMKRAALDASNILAEVAGVKTSTKKSGKRQLDCKSVDHDAAEYPNRAIKDEPRIHDSEVATTVPEKATSCLVASPQFNHPWPEWIAFMEYLHEKNYFENLEHWADEGKSIFQNAALVRHASVGFGRERPDIFRPLSRKDLRVIASFGCPNTDRKASNASKRLRAHFGISEGEVCQQCKLKNSCPRAFAEPAPKIAAGTLDVVRVLSGFAGNASSDAELHMSYPKEVENSVCKLLKEIQEFSAMPRDPDFPKPAPIDPSLPSRPPMVKKRHESCTAAEKPGDWVCPNCDFMNFARNKACRECGIFRPRLEQEVLLGDWECPNSKCRFLNFSKNRVCRECQTERPTKAEWAGGERLGGYTNKEKPEDKLGHSWGSTDKRSLSSKGGSDYSPSSRGLLSRGDGRLRASQEWTRFIKNDVSKGKGAEDDYGLMEEGAEFSDMDSMEFQDTQSDEEGGGPSPRTRDSKRGESEDYHRPSWGLANKSLSTRKHGGDDIQPSKAHHNDRSGTSHVWQPDFMKREVSMRKDSEQDYEASEEDADYSDMDSLESQYTQSDIDLSDEEDESLSWSSSKTPKGKDSKASFKRRDDEGEEDKALSWLSPKISRGRGPKASFKWSDEQGEKEEALSRSSPKASRGRGPKSLSNWSDHKNEESDGDGQKHVKKKQRAKEGQTKDTHGRKVRGIGGPSLDTSQNSRSKEPKATSGRGSTSLFNWSDDESGDSDGGSQKHVKDRKAKAGHARGTNGTKVGGRSGCDSSSSDYRSRGKGRKSKR